MRSGKGSVRHGRVIRLDSRLAGSVRRLSALLLVAVLAIACGRPRIDASTGEKLKRSLQKVRDSLPAKKRADFDAALGTIYASQVSFDTLARGFAGIASVGANVELALDGKNADEVIAYAEKLKRERPGSSLEQIWTSKMAEAFSPRVVTADRLKSSILEMTRAGAGTDVIVRYVRSIRLSAPLTAEQIVDWKSSGISDQVLAAAMGR